MQRSGMRRHISSSSWPTVWIPHKQTGLHSYGVNELVQDSSCKNKTVIYLAAGYRKPLQDEDLSSWKFFHE